MLPTHIVLKLHHDGHVRRAGQPKPLAAGVGMGMGTSRSTCSATPVQPQLPRRHTDPAAHRAACRLWRRALDAAAGTAAAVVAVAVAAAAAAVAAAAQVS